MYTRESKGGKVISLERYLDRAAGIGGEDAGCMVIHRHRKITDFDKRVLNEKVLDLIVSSMALMKVKNRIMRYQRYLVKEVLDTRHISAYRLEVVDDYIDITGIITDSEDINPSLYRKYQKDIGKYQRILGHLRQLQI